MPESKKTVLENMNLKFKDETLFELALTHRSFVHEKKLPLESSNERLEFLGDAVLGMCIAEMLVKAFPTEPEGTLSKRRAALVNQKQLAKLATDVELGQALKLGRGEDKTGGREKKSLLCDAYEAVIGALYLDQGMAASRRYLEKVFTPLIPNSKDVKTSQDYKTRLQEHYQSAHRKSPRYVVIQETGPDHSKTFEVQIEFQSEVIAKGVGSSKREAEQAAAEKAFELLELSDKNPPPKRKRKRKQKLHTKKSSGDKNAVKSDKKSTRSKS